MQHLPASDKSSQQKWSLSYISETLKEIVFHGLLYPIFTQPCKMPYSQMKMCVPSAYTNQADIITWSLGDFQKRTMSRETFMRRHISLDMIHHITKTEYHYHYVVLSSQPGLLSMYPILCLWWPSPIYQCINHRCGMRASIRRDKHLPLYDVQFLVRYNDTLYHPWRVRNAHQGA